MIKFNMVRDINGFNGFGLPVSEKPAQTTLVAGIEQTVTVPQTTDATYPNVLAIFNFQPGSSIWVAKNFTATLPGISFQFNDSEMNPAARRCVPGDVWHFITNDTTAEIGVIFYATA